MSLCFLSVYLPGVFFCAEFFVIILFCTLQRDSLWQMTVTTRGVTWWFIKWSDWQVLASWSSITMLHNCPTLDWAPRCVSFWFKHLSVTNNRWYNSLSIDRKLLSFQGRKSLVFDRVLADVPCRFVLLNVWDFCESSICSLVVCFTFCYFLAVEMAPWERIPTFGQGGLLDLHTAYTGKRFSVEW